MSDSFDVIIIGAGPAGSVAGSLLTRRGWRVLVIERARFPRFSIGESLLPQCMEFIEEAGMLEAVAAHGFQYKDGAVFEQGERRSEFLFEEKFTEGRGWAYEVQRAEFDQLLADEAARAGVEIHFEETITVVDFDGDTAAVETTDASGTAHRYTAEFVLDASGFGRVLARMLGLESPSGFPVRRSIFTHVADHMGPDDYNRDRILISIHPDKHDVWYWLIPFTDGRSSIGVVATEGELDNYPGEPADQLRTLVGDCPGMNRLLTNAEYDSPIGAITGYSARVKTLWGKRFALLGNAGEFLDPVFSSGVTIAMKSASMAAALLDRQLRGETVDWQAEYARPLSAGVATFRAYVEAWYDRRFQDIIFHPDQPASIKAGICSVLAGYAWDRDNPYVRDCTRRLSLLSELCAPR